MPIELFKVLKRGPSKLIAELSDLSAGYGSAYGGNPLETNISVAFGYLYMKADGNKYVVRGTASEFALLVDRIALQATTFEGTKENHFRLVPPAERAAYAATWLRRIADKMEGNSAEARASESAKKIDNVYRHHTLTTAKGILRILRLYVSTDSLPNGMTSDELRTEVTEFTGVTYETGKPGTEAALAGLEAWIAAQGDVP